MQKEKIIIATTVFIDVLGIGIVIPILPYYVESFGVSTFVLTLLFSVFSLFSFISAPMLGALSDKIGRRPVLILSIVSTALGWLVFASANAVWVLFLGRIIDGMAAGNLPVAESYLVDIAKDEKERTANFGLIGTVFGVGFIVGPAIGAALSVFSHTLPFYVVGALATFNAIGAWIFLPETNRHKNKAKKISINPFKPLVSAFKMKILHSRFVAWFLFGLAIAGMQAVIALYMHDVFGFDAQATGTMFTIMGILMVINQAVLLKKFWLKKFQESSLETWLFLVYAIGFILLATQSLFLFAVGILINLLSRSVLRIVISSRVAGLAGVERRGEISGVMSSITALANIGGPIIAGIIFEVKNFLPFVVSSVMLLIAFVVMKFCCNDKIIGTDEVSLEEVSQMS